MRNFFVFIIYLLPLHAFAITHENIGGWIISEDINKLTDKKEYSAILPPNHGDGALVLRCMNNFTDAFLATDEYFGSKDYTKITYRFEKNKASVESWEVGGNSDTAFVPKAIPFIKKLKNYNNITIGYKPYAKTQMILEFNIEGIDKVAEELSKTCGWKL